MQGGEDWDDEPEYSWRRIKHKFIVWLHQVWFFTRILPFLLFVYLRKTTNEEAKLRSPLTEFLYFLIIFVIGNIFLSILEVLIFGDFAAAVNFRPPPHVWSIVGVILSLVIVVEKRASRKTQIF